MTKPRTYVVTRDDARRTVAEWLHRHLKLSWNEARRAVKEGRVSVEDRPCRDANQRLQRGQRIVIASTPLTPNPSPPQSRGSRIEDRGSRIEDRSSILDPRLSGGRGEQGGIIIHFQDEHVAVVEKPAGLTTMRHAHEAAEFGQRARRFLPITLEDLLPGLLQEEGLKKPAVIAVHRLDKETSGLVVFARTPEAARHLGGQLRAHSAQRCYLALVRGQAKDAKIESWLVRDRGDGRRGSGDRKEGQRAVTHVKVVETLGAFTLVECRLETGRTHQVRIHLGEAGTPLCGERIYDRPLHGKPVPDGSGAKRTALHAASLDFDHPTTGQRMHFTSPLPRDLQQLLKRLRRT